MENPLILPLAEVESYVTQLKTGKVNGDKLQVPSSMDNVDQLKAVLAKEWLIYAEIQPYKPTLASNYYDDVKLLYKTITKKDPTDEGVAELLWEYQAKYQEFNETMLNFVLFIFQSNKGLLTNIYQVLIHTAFKDCVPMQYR
jgi:hypothetical protein